ncbi:putative bifunctional diguanylate cyclase/phosphodiesterase [Pararhizobium sp.]|uniref:putative bifunctional diguanylate cyclase/phosphodiesterase n=1 Tax=Pararhizobium sp. TaxID=1977563 RepID=UPI00271E0D40|nr:bifunctional diguanylate cyclase/phosphodiesterase [Pararhizobium sp.]MDO9416330.1 bifunctional diguanylate cyclase/phosphodiesterase [Pararhizobium sp.]
MTPGKTKIRFLLVVALLAIPSLCFGWLFLAQSQKAITFAEQELAGIQYLRSIVPLFVDLGETHSPQEMQSLSAFEAMRAQMDVRFESGLLSEAVVNAFHRSPSNPESVRFALLALINRVSDTSNLTIDPELDSYYLMQTMVFHAPQLMSSLDALSNVMAANQAVPVELSQSASSIFVETVRLEDAAEDLRRAYTRALSSNLDGSLERKLSTKVETAMRAVHKLSIAGHRLRASILDGTAANGSQVYGTGAADEKSSVIAAWSTMGDNLERLVSKRLETLKGKRNIALGFSSIAAIVVFFMGLGVFRSLLVEMDEQIVFLAHHDAMTKLKNRAAFSQAMMAVLSESGSTAPFAVHAIDLDGFKFVNDTFGHHAGDEVLQATALRLLDIAGPDDVIGRRGGDEFVALQRNVETSATAEAFAARIVNVLNAPFQMDGKTISLSASVGSSISGAHGDTEIRLMQSADLALYAAKKMGKDQACLFSAAMEIEQRRVSALDTRVRNAVRDMDFSLAYQPQYAPDGHQITGFEALLRLTDLDGSPISPVLFIPVLERLGLIGEMGSWVLKQACSTAAGWPEEIVVAVNVSPLQFAKGQLTSEISQALRETGLPPQRLQLEITESAILDDTEIVLKELNDIKALGVSIAMDDFGTGYSSLSSLWRFPFDKIKIDKSFLSNRSERGHLALNTVRSIVALAHSLSMSVTVEGVETQAQAALMAELKCDQLQGFYFSKPIPEVQLAAFILNNFLVSARVAADISPATARLKNSV